MKYVFIIMALFFLSCQHSKTSSSNIIEQKEKDTIPVVKIGNWPITDEISGSAYRKRATAYAVITDQDTSDVTPIIMEYKDRSIGLQWDSYPMSQQTYTQRMKELKLILPKMAAAYPLDSLKTLRIGRLVQTGDLAIQITRQYQETFGSSKVITMDYKKIESFLLTSQLGIDFNELLKSYSLSVKAVDVEKVFFTSKSTFPNSELQTEGSSIPDHILDCSVFLRLHSIIQE